MFDLSDLTFTASDLSVEVWQICFSEFQETMVETGRQIYFSIANQVRFINVYVKW